jgi:hypothetical protein
MTAPSQSLRQYGTWDGDSQAQISCLCRFTEIDLLAVAPLFLGAKVLSCKSKYKTLNREPHYAYFSEAQTDAGFLLSP